ncbi:MAG: rhomboid family intramembrane serine protease [Candidatus Nanohaloarchaea archaeon]|nr:rhomboid family intramembrane serine protease [Candidatus Nanohaloarchaea archaeon]
MERRFYALKMGALLIAVYLLQLLFPSLTGLLSLRAETFMQQPWTIVTSFFIHAPSDYMHLLNNLFFLIVFGSILEGYISGRRFLLLYLASGIVANLSAFIFYPEAAVLGASGAISGVVGYLAVLKPRQAGLFWGVPLPMWAVLIGWVATNAVGIGASAGIAFEAHLLGIVFGGIAAFPAREVAEQERSEDVQIDEEQIREWEERYLHS